MHRKVALVLCPQNLFLTPTGSGQYFLERFFLYEIWCLKVEATHDHTNLEKNQLNLLPGKLQETPTLALPHYEWWLRG